MRKGESSSNSHAPDPEVTHSANLAGKLCLLTCLKSPWVINSGATDHVSHDLSYFSSYEPLNATILVSDGKRVDITHIGTIFLNNGITLSKVLYAPHFQFNLISVNKLCKDMNASMSFTHAECYLQGHFLKGPPLLLGSLVGGLYHLKSDFTVQGASPPNSPSQVVLKYANTSVVNNAQL